MQTGGGRSHGTRYAREQALVTLGVLPIGVAADVGRQRHAAISSEKLDRFGRQLHAKEILVATEHGHITAHGVHQLPGAQRLAGPHVQERLTTLEGPLQQHLHGSAARFATLQSRRDHPRVVEYQEVIGPQEARQVDELSIDGRAGAPLQNEQPRGRTLGQRPLGNQLLGELEIEVGG